MEGAPIPSTQLSSRFNQKATDTSMRGKVGNTDCNQMALCPRKTLLEKKRVRRRFGEATSRMHSDLIY